MFLYIIKYKVIIYTLQRDIYDTEEESNQDREII